MAILKCKMCGGTIEFEEGASIGVCDSCGTKQTLPKTSDDVKVNLFNRANNLRLKCEFDKAEAIYEKIVEEDDSESEAHWGIVLCKYGIEYVDDPATGKKVPTCHRTLFDAVTKDADYQAAIDYSDVLQQTIYESEAREIDKIQRGILSIVENEKPFDVFICYKETDDDGNRTQDSVIANDIYYQLTQEGFKVFYAAITLEDKLGQEYEPYIFAALNSAKVLLAIGTKPEYFNAVWVKNEWSRFMSFMKPDRSKLLIPCYKDMDAYDLPEEFSHLQAQDMSKIGFINDVVRGIKKVIEKENSTVSEVATVVPAMAANSNVVALLKRGFLALEDMEWDNANNFFEEALNQDAENAQAYLGKLMSDLHVSTKEDIKNAKSSFEDNKNYQKAIRFGDENLKEELEADINFIKERIERNKNRIMKIFESGESFVFGNYKGEAISWKVISIDDNKALIISEYGIDTIPYNKDCDDVTWETCTLRKYMNNEMLNEMFNQEEQKAILKVLNKNPNNPEYGTKGENDTEDKLFLLSLDEANKFFANDEARCAKPTAYAKNKGALTDDAGNAWWWLRSPGNNSDFAADVLSDGSVGTYGDDVYGVDNVVRPACWVNLENL